LNGIPATIDDLERQGIVRARSRAEDGGIWAHSTDRSYIIFCVGQKDHQVRRFLRFALKNSLGFKPLRGCFKGREERSFIVNSRDFSNIKPFVAGQESILLLHSYNRADVPRATLINLKTAKRTELGWFSMATEKVKQHCDSWTLDPMTGVYYVTDKHPA
jgi:hypothetical protein